ncbi:MAG: plastocyanin/azurin family copper-binding protein, partial [Thermoleophilaceae bacterium]
MTRLAGITTIYALIAALVLVAPLSASEEVPPEASPPETTPAEGLPTETVPTETEPTETEPTQTLPTEAVAPETVPSEPAQPAPAAESVPAAEPAPPSTQPDARPTRDRKPRATVAASTAVTIRDFEFAPGSVTIGAGDTVTWNNQGPTPHSATAKDGSFDTGVYGEGQSRSHTFEQAGTFSYFCTPHPFMRGTVTVQAASSGGGSGGGETDAGDTAAGDTGAGAAGSD